MYLELAIIFLIFASSYFLILKNFRISLYLLLTLSVFLHKELFSFFRWDLLPIRAFMLALLCAGITNIYLWIFRSDKKKKINDLNILKDPFIILIGLLWLIRGVSIYFSRNLDASLLLYGFFTTIVFLVVYLINYFKSNPGDILKYLKFYLYLVFGLTLFGYFQYFLYWKTGIIIGAFWNIPGNISRVGATFWDVNHYASLLAAMLPISSILLLTEKGFKKKILYTVISLSLLVTLFLTNSRSAWIMEGVAGLTFAIVFLIKKFGYKSLFYLLMVLLLITGAFGFEYSKKDSPFRAQIKQYFHYRMDSFDAHFLLLEGAIQIFNKYPIIGGGYGGFFEHFGQTKVAAEFFGRDPAAFSTRFPAHTLWGELLAETGVMGFSVWVLLSILVLTSLLKTSMVSKKFEVFMLGAGMFSVIIGWYAAGIFYSYNSEFFWIVFCLFFSYGIANLGDKYTLSNVISFLTTSRIFAPLVLIIISAILIFVGLGNYHLIPWDESIYAKIAKNMVVNNEYIVQYWKTGTIWYEKPPFFMWSMAFSMKLLGFVSFAAKLPSALFGLGTVFIIYLFGKKLFNKTVGFLSAFSLVTTIHFLYYSRQAMTDVTNTFFITFALYLYWLAKEKSLVPVKLNAKFKNPTLYWTFSGVLIGLAVMTKGVVGLLPFAIIGLYELYLFISKKQKLSVTSVANYITLFISSLIIFLPWHVEMYRRFGMDFINNYLGYHVISRATEAIENKGQPWWWYFVVIKISMRLWFVVLLASLPWFICNIFGIDITNIFRSKTLLNSKRNIGNIIKDKLNYLLSIFNPLIKVNTSKFVFIFIWSAFILLFFSVAKSKLVWYIVPIYPVLSLIVGAFIEHVLAYFMGRFKILANPSFKFVSIFIIILISLMYLFYNKELAYPGDLTGSQVRLLTLKDATFGTNSRVFLDRIELPLAMFYTDSPFEIIDYQPEKGRVPQVFYEEDMIVIAKKGRSLMEISGMRANKKIIREDGDWVLFSYESEYETDKAILDTIRKDLGNPQISSIDRARLLLLEESVVTRMKNSAGIVMYYPAAPLK